MLAGCKGLTDLLICRRLLEAGYSVNTLLDTLYDPELDPYPRSWAHLKGSSHDSRYMVECKGYEGSGKRDQTERDHANFM